MATVHFGELDVTWTTTAFKKVRYYTMENLGQKALDLPSQTLSTTGTWIVPEAELLSDVARMGLRAVEGLVGIRNMAISVLPLFSMCDRRDIGGIVESSNTGSPTMFLYDRFEGGLGFAETGYHRIEELLRGCLELVRECDCEDGCPSCVGLPILRPPIQQDPDAGGSWPIPDKESARLLLEALLSAE